MAVSFSVTNQRMTHELYDPSADCRCTMALVKRPHVCLVNDPSNILANCRCEYRLNVADVIQAALGQDNLQN